MRPIVVIAFCLLAVAGASAQTPVPTVADNGTAAIAAAPSAPTATATPADEHPRVLYPLNGAPSPAAGTARGNTEMPGLPGLATTFLTLLALCGVGYYLLRRQPGFAAGSKGPRKLLMSESRSLGNRQFLVVVEYESERILLGVTPGKIDYLCPLPMPAASSGHASKV